MNISLFGTEAENFIPKPRRRGRPRANDPRDALDVAVRTFWSDGYEGTSLGRLSQEMRMPKASIYQLFGDKEGLFLAAVSHYSETRIENVLAAVDAPGTPRQKLTGYFESAITLATSDPATPGCLISCVLAQAAGNNARFRDELDLRYRTIERHLAAALSQGQRQGASQIEPATAAMMVAAVGRGLMLRARAGTDARCLRKMASATISMIFDLHFKRIDFEG